MHTKTEPPTATSPDVIVIGCEYCGAPHVANYSHQGQFDQGPVYTAVCTAGPEWYEDNYTLTAELPGWAPGPDCGPMGIPLPVRTVGAAA